MKQLELSDYRKVNESYHHKYNLRHQSVWRRILAHWLAFRTYGEYVRLSQDVAYEPDKFYHIPALGISCSYTEAYAMLARIIWQPQPEVQ